MHDSTLMRMLHGVADFREQFQSSVAAKPLLVGVPRDWRSRDEFHRDKRLRTERRVSGAGLEYLRDVRMPEARQQLRFVLKAVQHMPTERGPAQHLQRDGSRGAALRGLVYDTGGAVPHNFLDEVAGEFATCNEIEPISGTHGVERGGAGRFEKGIRRFVAVQ